MAKGNISLDFILKNKKLYFILSEKHKEVCKDSNCSEHFLVFISAISGCVLILAFASLVGVPVGITSSAVGLKTCTLTAGIKKFKSINKKKKEKSKII